MSETVQQADVDSANAAFWNELCGSSLARAIGVTDDSPASLRRFDNWFFLRYPYLFYHIPFDLMKGKDVLEVGLGYGTVSQHCAEWGAKYRGLDIAQGPVAMVNHRLRQLALPGEATQGSILEAPFPDGSFDYVIAIGCLHHTGNMQAAINECRRLLRPRGQLIMMVYYAYSYRRIFTEPKATARYLAAELSGRRGASRVADARERKAYDSNAAGKDAPHTDWVSVRSLRKLCKDFTSFSAVTENIDLGRPYQKRKNRRDLLRTPWPRIWGLDLYATATK